MHDAVCYNNGVDRPRFFDQAGFPGAEAAKGRNYRQPYIIAILYDAASMSFGYLET
ncbi:MAG: hypothetical protein ABI472_10210 [Ginsengibacter sp.]